MASYNCISFRKRLHVKELLSKIISDNSNRISISFRVIRMSSPVINNVILLGCFLCYVYVLLLGIVAKVEDDYIFAILCKVSGK